jgi:polysaccharide export outer membrane protein
MKTFFTLTCAMALSVSFPSSSYAAALQSAVSDKGPIAKMSVPRTRESTAFVLGPGDQISIHVADLDDISDKPIRIEPDGSLDLPLVGRVQAAGLSVGAFKVELAAKLAKYITNPQISVNLIDGQSSSVSVIGEVNAPGVHVLAGPRSLIEVISLAGGTKQDAGSTVVVTREMKYGMLPLVGAKEDQSGRYSTATLSLDDLMASKDPAENIIIQPEDIVSIPKGDIVYVIGDVKRAGGFPLNSHATMTLLQALALAEGLGPDAATQKAKILRPVAGEGKTPLEIPVNVKLIFAGKAPDVPVYANDILFIPNSAARSGARRAAEAVLQVATGVAVYR